MKKWWTLSRPRLPPYAVDRIRRKPTARPCEGVLFCRRPARRMNWRACLHESSRHLQRSCGCQRGIVRIITVTIVDFEKLAQAPDTEIIRRFFMADRSSKKRLVPKSVTALAKQVRRELHYLAIALFDEKEKQVAEFRFAPIAS